MTAQQSASPQPVGSRASTVHTFGSNESGVAATSSRQPAMTPPSSASQGSGVEQVLLEAEVQANQANDSKQTSSKGDQNGDDVEDVLSLKELSKVNITLHYGDRYGEEYMVHLGMLLRHSPQLRRLFIQAEKQRYAYDQGTKLRKKLRSLLPPEISKESFCDEKTEILLPQAIAHILKCFKDYPLMDFRAPVRKHLVDAVDAAFQAPKYMKAPPSKGGFQRKNYPKNEVEDRLQLLNAAGVYSVIESLYQTLRIVKRREESNVRIDRVKAAAQRKLFLKDCDAPTVSSFVQWVYFGKLDFDNATQLCKIHTLAEQLGVGALADTCLTMLSDATLTIIQAAKDHGYTLRDLVDEELKRPDLYFKETAMGFPPALRDVVPVVFQYVLRDHSTSTLLQHLVINAIADSNDLLLFHFLKPYFSLEMALDLTEAMFLRASNPRADATVQDHEDHSPESADQSIKSEIQPDGNGGAKRKWEGTG